MHGGGRRRVALGSGLLAATLLLVSCSSVQPVQDVGSSAGLIGATTPVSQLPSTAPVSTGLSGPTASNPVLSTAPVSTGRSSAAASNPDDSTTEQPSSTATFTNPVVTQDFPDPSMLEVDGTFYLYGTEHRGTNLQLQTSVDLVHWTEQPDPLPVLGGWADRRKTWAPEATRVGDSFVLFYTAAARASGKQCIGRAVSGSPAGPFVDDAVAPFLCQVELGGSIDANPIVAPNGDRYLYWKSDGNCCGQPVGLWGQRLDDAAAAVVGEPVELLTNTMAWQGPLIEGPEMVVHDGEYFLFYSGNSYNTALYAEGVARCDGPLGPCTDSAEPVLASNDVAVGPGHGFVFRVGEEWWIVYHAYPPDAVGQSVPGRQVWLDRVRWTPDGPMVDGPTGGPQPAPGI